MIFFRVGLEESITLPAPPIDDKSEAEEVKVIVANRSAKDVESIRNHDQEPFYAIRKFCEKKGLIFHDGEFDQIIDESVPIISYFKKHLYETTKYLHEFALQKNYNIPFDPKKSIFGS